MARSSGVRKPVRRRGARVVREAEERLPAARGRIVRALEARFDRRERVERGSENDLHVGSVERLGARFDDRASDYVRYRPSYPVAAIDWILEGVGPPATLVAADVGAGTGISARLLGDRGVRVLAIEPGVKMRGAAAAHPRVTWVGGTAEATGLATGAVGLVLAAQAFHWFRPPQAIAEFARILHQAGRLAIMWNRRNETDPLTAGYGQAIVAAGDETGAERIHEPVNVAEAPYLHVGSGGVVDREGTSPTPASTTRPTR